VRFDISRIGQIAILGLHAISRSGNARPWIRAPLRQSRGWQQTSGSTASSTLRCSSEAAPVPRFWGRRGQVVLARLLRGDCDAVEFDVTAVVSGKLLDVLGEAGEHMPARGVMVAEMQYGDCLVASLQLPTIPLSRASRAPARARASCRARFRVAFAIPRVRASVLPPGVRHSSLNRRSSSASGNNASASARNSPAALFSGSAEQTGPSISPKRVPASVASLADLKSASSNFALSY
jgi:hypothetical protein